MIDLYYAPTPNGWKITIMLEECGMPYTVFPVNLGAGDQFKPEFLAISPNNRMPAIVDQDNGQSVFESGAILVYLAEKSGQFMPTQSSARIKVLEWLFWQVGGLGPMAGQLSHFVNYAPGGPESNDYAHTRYAGEYDRLFSVMERSLRDNEFLAGDYSIADMASWPWIVPYKHFKQDMTPYPNVRRWFDAMKSRPAVQRGMDVGKAARSDPSKMTDEQRKRMFLQTGASVAAETQDKAT